MFHTFNYFKQHNDGKPIDDYKAFYARFSASREFGGEFSAMDHIVKHRFMDCFGLACNALLRQRPRKLLDIGCGNGVYLPLSKIFEDVEYHGLDYAEGSLEAAKRGYPAVKFHVEDAFHTSFPDDTFDMAILSVVLVLYKERDEQVELLREARRVLAPGGVLFLVVLRDSLFLKAAVLASRLIGRARSVSLPDDFMAVHFRDREIRGVVADAGFTIEETIPTAQWYGVLECVRHLNLSRYRRTFGKAEAESGRRHPQSIKEDLINQSGSRVLTVLLYQLARVVPRLFSYMTIIIARKETGEPDGGKGDLT